MTQHKTPEQNNQTQQNEPEQVVPHIALAGFPVSHSIREKIYEDQEARVIQGRMWLISFTDLFSLLLCFFILMFSMKDPDFEKIGRAVGISQGSGYAGSGKDEFRGDQAGVGLDRVEYGDALDLTYLDGVLHRQLQQAGVEKDVKIVTKRDHLKLVIDDVGGDHGAFVARRLGERLTLLPNRITVIGIPTRWSSGDWAGSFKLAEEFAAQMKDGGYRKTITVTGEGDGIGPGIEIRVDQDNGRAH